jgi:hypothetical protein
LVWGNAHSYDKIGDIDISSYMYQKLKERRKRKRLQDGKLLVKEISPQTLAEIKRQREIGSSSANIARKFGITGMLQNNLQHSEIRRRVFMIQLTCTKSQTKS